MGTIIGSFGRVKPVLIIALCDLQVDGTVLNIEYEFDYTSTYSITTINPVDGMLYTITGKLNSFGSDPMRCPHDKNKIDWIIIDKSTTNNSNMVRIFVKNIKSIKKVEELT